MVNTLDIENYLVSNIYLGRIVESYVSADTRAWCRMEDCEVTAVQPEG